MSGHGEKLTRLKEAAIAALLTEPNIAQAATTAGVSEKTLRKWLKHPDFMAAFRAEARRILEVTVARLQKVSMQAVDVLTDSMTDKQAALRLKAATVVLDKSFKAAEIADLEQRVQQLEEALQGGMYGGQ